MCQRNRGKFRETSSVADLGALASATPLVAWTDAGVVATKVDVDSWADLQAAVNNGQSAKLVGRVAAALDDSPITVSNGTNATIDLNGQALDRGLASASAVANGSVIVVKSGATLAITDSSEEGAGRITGGNTTGSGGGIYNSGTLTIEGGTVSGNSTTQWGGGVYLSNEDGAILHLDGGKIENNSCASSGNGSGNGGGVHVSENARMYASGDPVVTDNAKGAGASAPANDVSLANGAFIYVSNTLAEDARIGVRMSNDAGNITSGLKGRGGAQNFFSNNADYEVAIDGSGEAYLFKKADETANSWVDLQSDINNSSSSQIIALSEDVIAASSDGPIKVDGKKVTLDLKGNALNRNLISEKSNGHVIELVNGANLTIRDTAGGGTVAGGWSENGGGIYINEGCTCTITGGTVTSNNASDDGAGILVKGTLKMTGGAVSGNTASDDGGGIYVSDTGAIDLTNATITYNVADGGGGLKIRMGADSSIAHSKITHNTSYDYGGGILMDASGKTLVITDTAINHNTSSDDGAGICLDNGTINMSEGSLSDNFSDYDSGGAKITKGTTFTATDVEISNNTARDEEGGGVKSYGTTTLTGCTITGNTAKKQGGGVYNNDTDGSKGELTLEDCTITGNKSSDVGGGVYSNNKLTLVGGSITNNSATKQGGGIFLGNDSQDTIIGGKVVVKDNKVDANGPDIYLRNGKLSLSSALIEGAQIGVTKEDDGGLDVFTSGYSTYNGTIAPKTYFFSPEGLDVDTKSGEAALVSSWSDLASRIKNAEDGETITLERGYTASPKEDRLQIPEGKTITIDLAGYTLNRNRTSKGSDGHVIEVFGTLILKDGSQKKTGTITGGWAKRGGGINVSSSGKLVLEGGTISGNKSDDGGGIYNHGTLEMNGGTVCDNTASDKWGGGIYNEEKMTMTAGTVTGNYSDRDGGGIYSEGTTDISGGSITANTAKKSGGGIRVNGGTTTITGGEISGNTTTDDHGGGIYMSKDSSILNLYGGSITNNSAFIYGGGIYVDKEVKAINLKGNPVVKENRAAERKDIYLQGGKQFTVTGALTAGATLYVDSEKNGQVTSGYSGKNPSVDPTTYFFSDKGLPVFLNNGEVYIESKWTNLQRKINEAAENGGTVTLTSDYEALSSDDRLQIPKDKSVSIDLAGHTLNRNRTERDDDGHVIEVFGTLTLKDSSASGNTPGAGTVTGGYAKNGGGINVSKSGKLVLQGGTITGNKANDGGGIYNHGTLEINGGVVKANEAEKDGGGIYSEGTAAISGGTISGNTAKKSGGGVRIEDSTATIGGGVISGNTATEDHGGGIYISDGTLKLYGGEISGNTAGQEGGGVLVAADAKDIYLHGAPVVKENTAGIRGSNIYLRDDKIKVDGQITGTQIGVAKKGGDGVFTSDFSVKSGVSDPATCFIPGAGYKISWDDEANKKEAKFISLWPEVQKKINEASDKGTVTLDSDYTAASSDDRLQIPKDKTITLDLAGYTLNRNRTSKDENGHVIEVFGTLILKDSSADKTGRITGGYANNGGGINVSETGTLKLESGTIIGNKAENGGGIYNHGTLTMSGGTVSNNRANDKWGGGIYNEKTMTMTGGTVTQNYSDRDGGGIYTEGTASISGGSITANTAKKSGGGVRVNGGTTTIAGGEISDNTATEENGGAIYISKSESVLNISGGTMSKNYAEDHGGAIYNNGGTVNMTGGTVSENEADDDGGAIFNDGTLTVSGGTIEKNTAARDGGGIYSKDKTTVSGAAIKDNTTTKSGGGIFVKDGTTEISGGTITGNKAIEDHGGGVYTSDGTLKLYGGEISGNTAAQEGGGVLAGSDTDKIYIHGAPVVKENTATVRGSNIYLREDKMNVDGVLNSSAELCVAMKSGTGQLTADYDDYENPTEVEGIAKIFTPEKGLKLAFKDGEVRIVSDWSTLHDDLKAVKGVKEFVLPQDYTAGDDDDRLQIPEGATITIDLAGYTLNRNRVSKDSDGHVFEVFGTLILKDSSADKTGIVTGGWAKHGGGINVSSSGKLVLEGGTISGNKASEWGGGIYNRGILEMSGGTVSQNEVSDKDGGGVYTEGTTTISGGAITKNTAKKSGGGIRLNGGTVTFSGGELSGNTATEDHGGGIYISKDSSVLQLSGGEITGNAAGQLGAGIYVSEGTNAVKVKGTPVVKDNTSGLRNDIYLPYGEKLTLTGKLDEGCNIGVSLEKDWGVFTSGYSTYTNTEEEVTFLFTSSEGFSVYLDGTEVALGRDAFGETEFERPFIDMYNQIRDSGALRSTNWMAGLSGERYLNEINMPASHDSAMADVETHVWGDWTSIYTAAPSIAILAGIPITFGLGAVTGVGFAVSSALFATLFAYTTVGAKAYPQTQILYIDEQLDAGARKFDLRLNNKHKVQHWYTAWGWTWEDDGENLYLNHGKKAAAGTFQALDHDGNQLTLNKVLEWMTDFLEKHPSETLIVDMSPETSKSGDLYPTMMRARKILRDLSQRTNSATGESFLYKEPGSDDYFAPYTHTPLIKDCRGKIVIQTSDEYLNLIGGYTTSSFGLDYHGGPDFSFTPEHKVKAFLEKVEGMGYPDNPMTLLTDATSTYDAFWQNTTNCTSQEDILDYLFALPTPIENSEYVFDKLFGEGKFFSSERTGQYIGWISMDAVNKENCDIIWRTNFFDGLEYCTVTVQTGLDPNVNPSFKNYKTQTYKLLKGSDFTIPGCVYKNLPADAGYFAGWKSDDGEDYAPGATYTISEDVTFTAQWLTNGEVPVTVKWLDGDDADDLRPAQISAKVSFDAVPGKEDETVTIGEDGGWRASIAEAASKVVPLWERIIPAEGFPNGQDKDGEYRYDVAFEEGVGHTITLVHTPDRKVSVSGSVVWDDAGDEDGKRPQSVTVRLFKSGQEVEDAEKTVTGVGDEWSYSFEDLPRYEDGEEVAYSVAQDPIEDSRGYTTNVDGSTIRNSHVTKDSSLRDEVGVLVEWVDNDNEFGMRPDLVKVRLLADGEEVASKDVVPGNTVRWVDVFEDLPVLNDDGERIRYTITQDAVDGCMTEFEEHANEGMWLVSNIYGQHDHEWTFTGFEWIGDEESGYTAAFAIYQCEAGPVAHEKAVGITFDDASVVVTEPTCETGGKTEYTATVAAEDSLDGKEHSEVREAMLVGAKGHDWEKPEYAWSEDMEECTATRVCLNDQTHVETAKAFVTSELTRDPTDTKPGERTYTARFDESWAVDQQKTVEVAAGKPQFATHSILLDGKIGVKFYMNLDALTDEQRANSSVTFTVAGRGGFTATDKFDPDDRNPSGSYYGFTCYVSSIQMADRITATFHCDGFEDVTDSYSVADYVAYTERNAEAYEAQGDAGEATLALVRAMADYGHHVQPFLSQTNGWSIGGDYARMPAAREFEGSGARALTQDDVAAAQAAVGRHAIKWGAVDGSGVAKRTFALRLNAGTDISLFYEMEGDASVSSAKVDDRPAEVVRLSGGRYRVTVPNISAHGLGQEHTVVVGTSKGKSETARVSALSYASALFAADAYRDNADARMAMTALYRYWDAAMGYLRATGQGA